jgi:hypothetical protein
LNFDTLFEVEIAIATLTKYKSLGSDEILAQLIQVVCEALRSEIHQFPNSVWDKEKLPDQWRETIILPVYKKSNKIDCIVGYHCYQFHRQFYLISFSQVEVNI